MPRKRKPLTLLKLQGTAQKCRIDARKGELELDGGESIPIPEWLTAEAAAEWGRLTSHPKYSRILASVDRGVLAMYCSLWSQFVAGEKSAQPVTASLVSQINILSGKLGLSPADRCKIHTQPEETTRNRFANLGR